MLNTLESSHSESSVCLCFSLSASVRLLSGSTDVGAVSTLCRHCDEGLGLWRIRREKNQKHFLGGKKQQIQFGEAAELRVEQT